MTGRPHPDVHVARQIAELVDDTYYCRDTSIGEHAVCLMVPRVACWPEPHPMHDLDDPDWRPI